ncbi:MAG TPA: phenylalanine--tRNA ligase subunit alpha [Thermoleophilia bacterium]|nr:phenylalanine--tRNA ligase subunit alpha [Thermoleophilia bacterium]
MDEVQLHDLQERTPELGELYAEAAAAVAAAAGPDELEQARVRFLGRKSRLTEILRSIATLSPEQRPVVGKLSNVVRVELERLVDEREAELSSASLQQALTAERIDVTLPGVPFPLGHRHLITRTIREVEDIFVGMGYQVAEGPEIELEYYNFTALNTPDDHPARSVDDTFFIDERTALWRGGEAPAGAARAGGDGGGPVVGDLLLRTQTSPVQVRTMEAQQPPVYIICPGKVYRPDLDATHTPMFHQVEGLAVDYGITLADLKGTLHQFAREFFGADRAIRLRPHFFPFTEPSVELDVSCELCSGEGCRSCKWSGWLEILGAGMVDPNLYGFVGYDPGLQGFAFGMGVERMAMLKHGVPDVRAFFDNDLRFLEQF